MKSTRTHALITQAQLYVRKRRITLLTELLRRHPQLTDQKNRRGLTLIDLAVDQNECEIIELLITMGCTLLNKPNAHDQTLVYRAIHVSNNSIKRDHTLDRSRLIEHLVRLGFTNMDYTNDFVSAFDASIIDKDRNAIHVLRCLGVQSTPGYRDNQRACLKLPLLSEDEIASVRYRVYFQESLVSRMIRQHTIIILTHHRRKIKRI